MRKLLMALFSLTLTIPAFSQDYFGSADVDYWNEGKKVKKRETTQKPIVEKKGEVQDKTASGPVSIRAKDAEPFNWADYTDPKSITFWDDGGDYVPPRPFREVATNPTPENTRRYLEWLNRKSEVTTKMQTAITDYASADIACQMAPEPPKLTPIEKQKKPIDFRKVDIVYFYQYTCHVCRSNIPVVEELKRLGARVIPVQIDFKTEPSLHSGSVPYSEKLKAQYPVNATPTWEISYQNHSNRTEGSLTLTEIYDVLYTLSI